MLRARRTLVGAALLLGACGDDPVNPYTEPLAGYHVTPIAAPPQLEGAARLTPRGQILLGGAVGEAGALWLPQPLGLPAGTTVVPHLAGEVLWFAEAQALAVWSPAGERLALPDDSDDAQEAFPNLTAPSAPLWDRRREVSAIGAGGEVWGVTYAFASPAGSPPIGTGFARAFVWRPGEATLHALGERLPWRGPVNDGSRVSVRIAPSEELVVQAAENAGGAPLVRDYLLGRDGAWTDIGAAAGVSLGSVTATPTRDGTFLAWGQDNAVWRGGELTVINFPVLAIAPSGWSVLGTPARRSLRAPDGRLTELYGFLGRGLQPIALDDAGRMLAQDMGIGETDHVLLTPDALPDPTPSGTLALADVTLTDADGSPVVMHAGGVNLSPDGRRLWLRLQSARTEIERGPGEVDTHVRRLELTILRAQGIPGDIALGTPYPVAGRAGAVFEKAGAVYTDGILGGRSPIELWGAGGTVTVERLGEVGLRVTLTDVEVASLAGGHRARLTGTLAFPVAGTLPM